MSRIRDVDVGGGIRIRVNVVPVDVSVHAFASVVQKLAVTRYAHVHAVRGNVVALAIALTRY